MHTVSTSSPKLKKPNQLTLNSALSIAKKNEIKLALLLATIFYYITCLILHILVLYMHICRLRFADSPTVYVCVGADKLCLSVFALYAFLIGFLCYVLCFFFVCFLALCAALFAACASIRSLSCVFQLVDNATHNDPYYMLYKNGLCSRL